MTNVSQVNFDWRLLEKLMGDEKRNIFASPFPCKSKWGLWVGDESHDSNWMNIQIPDTHIMKELFFRPADSEREKWEKMNSICVKFLEYYTEYNGKE